VKSLVLNTGACAVVGSFVREVAVKVHLDSSGSIMGGCSRIDGLVEDSAGSALIFMGELGWLITVERITSTICLPLTLSSCRSQWKSFMLVLESGQLKL
jgi:hypothetical protein